MPAALDKLRDRVAREQGSTGGGALAEPDEGGCSSDADDEDQAGARGGGGESRKDKSLGLMSQRVLQLFLMSQTSVLSLDEAAQLLLGEGACDAAQLKTKVRRLYDIANVLVSLQLIEKVHVDSRKPAFRWLGSDGSKRASLPGAAPHATASQPAGKRTAAPVPAAQCKQARRERAVGDETFSYSQLLLADSGAVAPAAAPGRRRATHAPAAHPPPSPLLPLPPPPFPPPPLQQTLVGAHAAAETSAAPQHVAFRYQSPAVHGVFDSYVHTLRSFAGAATQQTL